MLHLSKDEVEALFDYSDFIPKLKDALTKPVESPDRSHFSIPVPGKVDATLLTMPAWSSGTYFGVKIVSVFPENRSLPTINGVYLLMDGNTGQPLCTIDGLAITLKRTASVSALASMLLSQEGATKMLMIGTGNLCLELIKAHTSIRNLDRVWIWGRSYEKALSKSKAIELNGIQLEAIQSKGDYMPQADIISCATLSASPLVLGSLLKKGTYLDLVGSFQKHTREADDDCLINAALFVDTFKATEESGDLYIPLQEGLIDQDRIQMDLPTLCRTEQYEPTEKFHHTYFKSVGFAAPDLAAAVYLYEKSVQ